jgi:hypothetical protein
MMENKAVTLCQPAEFLLCGDVHVRTNWLLLPWALEINFYFFFTTSDNFQAITSIYAVKNWKSYRPHYYYSGQKAWYKTKKDVTKLIRCSRVKCVHSKDTFSLIWLSVSLNSEICFPKTTITNVFRLHAPIVFNGQIGCGIADVSIDLHIQGANSTFCQAKHCLHVLNQWSSRRVALRKSASTSEKGNVCFTLTFNAERLIKTSRSEPFKN